MAEEEQGILIDRKYRLLSELGSGAMGVVYRAEQLDGEGRPYRIVAVKTLRSELSKDENFSRRFLREVRVAMQLRSPHVLTVYDSGMDESGRLYYVMEYMPQTLKELMRQGPVPVERAVAITLQICDALAEAHSLPAPVVHRDIKPANIFLEQVRGKDRVKVGDFGIAKIISEEAPQLTGTGMNLGTPRYMAPEQWSDQALDGRTDLYALGVMLYEMLTGTPPFSGSLPVLMGKHLNEPPPPLPDSFPLNIRQEVQRLLAKDPKERPADAVSVQETLENALKATARPASDDESETPTIILSKPLSEIANSIGMKFILIPAGEFRMGSENGDNREKPIRKIIISQPFYLSKFPVTQAQWQIVMGNNPGRFKGELNRPVERVSWSDVQEFLRKLSEREGGQGYRLPTEAEWEYSCHAGSTGEYCFGDDATTLKEYAWYGENAGGTTHPVGQLKPNAWGLHDMHGNVWEWVQDWYGAYEAETVTDPSGPESGSYRVGRGGSWGSDAGSCRSVARGNGAPDDRDSTLGFRLLRTAS